MVYIGIRRPSIGRPSSQKPVDGEAETLHSLNFYYHSLSAFVAMATKSFRSLKSFLSVSVKSLFREAK